MILPFKRLQSRIAFFFLGLVSLVQSVVFITVDRTNTRQARAHIEQALVLGVGNFQRMMAQRTGQLVGAVRILTSDFAFKSALVTGDKATVHSVLANQRERVGADVMILLATDRSVIDDSRPTSGVYPAALGELVREAEAKEQAAGLVVLDDKAYQVVVLPVLGPEPIAWLVAGFALDDRLAQSLHQSLKLDVMFFEKTARGINPLASSLLPDAQARLVRSIAPAQELDKVVSTEMNGEEMLNYATRISTQGGARAFVLLQNSITEELKPFQEARNIVVLLSMGGLVLSVFGAYFIARSITRPVRSLLHAVRKVERGEYVHTVEVIQQDEVGELAGAFNRMVKGLVERDKVRDLFGKFVSRAVAEKLLSGDVVLGGEERQVTILFSDLRDFTSYAEQHPPQEVVALLNNYLTRMSGVIERNHGIVDKFLGDGIMALFGAPAAGDDDAGNALQAAIEMIEELDRFNLELRARALPALDSGIGINTAQVVAGNMGSPNRLNYTVIGDGVNLAARIEGLTKHDEYRTHIILTEATVRAAKRAFATRSLGLVVVRGKRDPVALYALDVSNVTSQERS